MVATVNISEYQNAKREAVRDLLHDIGETELQFRWLKCNHPDYFLIKTCPQHLDNHFYKEIPQSCMSRICAECCRMETARLLETYVPIYEKLHKTKKRGYRLRAITLTTDYEVGLGGVPRLPSKNGHYRMVDMDKLDTLVEQDRAALKELKHAITLLRRQLWEKQEFAGGQYTIEVGENGRKLHVHMLVYCKWISQDELKERWQKLTGCQVVYIEDAVKKYYGNVSKAVKETLKYVNKGVMNKDGFENKYTDGEVSEPELLIRIHLMHKGMRRTQPFGCVYNAVYSKPSQGGDIVEENEFCPSCGSRNVIMYNFEYVRITTERMEKEAETLKFKHANNLTKKPPHPPPKLPFSDL